MKLIKFSKMILILITIMILESFNRLRVDSYISLLTATEFLIVLRKPAFVMLRFSIF